MTKKNPFESKYDLSSKFKNASGVYYLQKLFIDFTTEERGTAIYCLTPNDHPSGKYPSLHRLYLETEDPTEWNFAQKYFDSWDHWVMVSNSAKVKPYVEKWRTELELKLRAKALKEIIDVADATNGAKNYYEANKFLVTGGWLSGEEKKEAAKRGRPSKEDIKSRAVREFIEGGEQVDTDLQRLEKYRAKAPN